MLLPVKYKWLATIGPLPKMVALGLNLLGIREIPGLKSNPIIHPGMSTVLGVTDIYKNDDTSWCALFIGYLCKMADKPLPDIKGDKFNMLRAKWFTGFGNAVPNGQEMLGDIGVFDRPGGGHVGIIIAESPNTFHVLGGNQSNAVTIAEILKSRLITARRYYAIGPPESVKQYHLSSSGVVSTNEA